MAAFPNVPDAPGVPSLPRDPSAPPQEAPPLLQADSVATFGQPVVPQWGIFRNGSPVILSDNTIQFDYRQEWSLLDYPVEEGGFETYNKVASPFDCRFRVSAGGNLENRQRFLSSIESIAGTTDLYDAYTPERIYTSVNVTHYDMRRTNVDGATLIKVDIWMLQVRVTAEIGFSNTKQPAGADPASNGIVQPTLPSPNQNSLIANGIFRQFGPVQ